MVVLQELAEQFSVARIVLASAVSKRFSIVRQGGWVDRKDLQVVVTEQRVDQSSFGLLDSNQERGVRELLSPRLNGLLDGVRILFEEPVMLFFIGEQMERMFFC